MARKISTFVQPAILLLLIGAIAWLELRHPFPKFRLATFILAFALFVDLSVAIVGAMRNALVMCASLAFGLSIAEAVADSAATGAVLSIDHTWSTRQPIMGWGPQRAGNFHAEMRDTANNSLIYSADYAIDSSLLRRTISADAGPTTVFFGDSFTFGDGVQNGETLPQAFADLYDRKVRVLNLAFTGYSPQQFLREMETGRFDSVIGPDPKLFIFLTASWHAERTSCKAYWTPHAPFYAVEQGRVTYKGECNEGAGLLLREWFENFAAYRKLIEPYRHQVNRADIELYVSELEAAVKMAKEKYRVPTIIPYLRVPKQYLQASGFTDDAIMERLRGAGAVVIDASLQKEEASGALISIKGDGHPTPLANRLRAAQIKAAIDEKMSNIALSDAK